VSVQVTTTVTLYTYDAANRLTSRSVSDGRMYTYDWSPRGQLLTEWTQSYPVRTFAYNAAGQMTQATVFTQTTRFVYNGDGARLAVTIDGHGATVYTLDYAADYRILAEQTGISATVYLYGYECLGEFRNNEWLYYLADGGGYVRQGADKQGQMVSAWLFDPVGTVLEGPEGPVSHLICNGVYDWSTGLVYKGGRYFDPTMGIWLTLTPLVVVQAWRGHKKGRRGAWDVLLVVLVVVGVGVTVTACGPAPTPTPSPICTSMRADFLHDPRTRAVDVDRPDPGIVLPAKALKLSDAWQNNHGIQFIGTVLAPQCVAEGNVYMIQNIAEKRFRRRLDGPWERRGDGTWMLDTSIPYDDEHTQRISGPGEVVYDTNYDAPSTMLVGDPKARDLVEVRVEDQFKMYMVWQPSNDANYYPLGRVNWYWQATATRVIQPDGQLRPEDHWNVVDNSSSDMGGATDEYPVTSPNVLGLDWVPISAPW
jgi:YD repeat-containing protein